MKTLNRIALLLSILLFATAALAQTQWTKYAGNPVLSKSDASIAWDMFAAADPSVIQDGDTLKMWYSGGGIILPDTTARVRIGYAWSLDGVNWTNYPENPVVSPTSGEWDSLAIETVTGSWNAFGMNAPSAVIFHDTLRVYYSATPDFLPFFAPTIVYSYLDSTLITTVNDADRGEVPSGFALSQNYPNPFNPQTTIQYQLASDGLVTLSIYNLLGQKVRTLVNKNQPAGSHSVVWDGQNDDSEVVSSGIYVYQIKSGESLFITRKLLLLK